MSDAGTTGSFDELVAVMDRLRSPGGCPWDARQTHASLVEYLIEEAYELVEAIESGDTAHMREELGDLLLQVVFHARIAQEEPEPYDIDDVAAGITTKLIARHPHVFGDPATTTDRVETPEDVEARWHALKAAEKGRASVTDGIPAALPALLLAAKLLARSDGLGVELPAAPQAQDILATLPQDSEGEDALGELLLALVAGARERGWDAEAALRGATGTHRERILQAEATA